MKKIGVVLLALVILLAVATQAAVAARLVREVVDVYDLDRVRVDADEGVYHPRQVAVLAVLIGQQHRPRRGSSTGSRRGIGPSLASGEIGRAHV